MYLERYFVVICFNAYLHDVIGNNGAVEKLKNVTYSQWIQERQDITNTMGTLDSGPLSKFSWDVPQ